MRRDRVSTYSRGPPHTLLGCPAADIFPYCLLNLLSFPISLPHLYWCASHNIGLDSVDSFFTNRQCRLPGSYERNGQKAEVTNHERCQPGDTLMTKPGDPSKQPNHHFYTTITSPVKEYLPCQDTHWATADYQNTGYLGRFLRIVHCCPCLCRYIHDEETPFNPPPAQRRRSIHV